MLIEPFTELGIRRGFYDDRETSSTNLLLVFAVCSMNAGRAQPLRAGLYYTAQIPCYCNCKWRKQ